MEKFKESLGIQINIIARSMKSLLEKELAPFNVSPSHWILLMALGENDHQTQTDLAKIVNLDNATVTRIIDKLAEMGLLVRNQDMDDRRMQIVSLTSKGRIAFRKWNVFGQKVNQIATKNLSIAEKKNLLKIMAQIKHNLDTSN
jgi:DNA-binding MarR family transcriptional regulator